MIVRVAIREREVCRVVRHRMTLGLYAHLHIRQREVGLCGLGNSNALYRVALLL